MKQIRGFHISHLRPLSDPFQNLDAARVWLQLAAAQNDKEAQRELNDLKVTAARY